MILKDQVTLITGGGSGIGAASARRLAREGARVALLGRREAPLEQVAEAIREAGGDALPVVGDVVRPESLEEAYRRTDERWGRLDVVFANAGINGVWAPLAELDPDEWRKTLDVNLTGTFHTIKYALPYLEERGGSVIINSSVNGTRIFSNTGATAYACSKGGQLVLGKMLALELAGRRIRVNVICPGWTETDIDERTEERDLEKARESGEVPDTAVPLTDDRPGSSDQVAELVLFLASDASSHITGTEVWIDGGQSLLKG